MRCIGKPMRSFGKSKSGTDFLINQKFKQKQNFATNDPMINEAESSFFTFCNVNMTESYQVNQSLDFLNCQRCVLTYEARRRGYDVTALPTYSTDMMPKNNDYLRALSNPKVVDIQKSTKKLESQMKSYGNGSRAIIQIRKGRNGHVFIAENKNGKVQYIDPQTNERYNKVSFKHVSNVSVIRIDNQSFTEYAKNAFTRQKV